MSVFKYILKHGESSSLDEKPFAGRAIGVFVPAQLTGQVARIDKLETTFMPDLRSPDERTGGRVARIHHFVVGMEGRHMPGDLRRNGGDEPGNSPDLSFGVVVSRNQQSHDFEPESHLVKLLDRIEDMIEDPAELPVPLVVEPLQVDLVKVDPRPNIFKYLGRPIPV